MAKHFNPADFSSIKTDITFAPATKSTANFAFLARRVARSQRRHRRAL